MICICWENICSGHFAKSLGAPFHISTVPYGVLSHFPKEKSKNFISCCLSFRVFKWEAPTWVRWRKKPSAVTFCGCRSPRGSEPVAVAPASDHSKGCSSCDWSVLWGVSKSLSWASSAWGLYLSPSHWAYERSISLKISCDFNYLEWVLLCITKNLIRYICRSAWFYTGHIVKNCTC